MTSPYYSDDLVTLYHGDCEAVMATMPDRSFDCIVADPPYGIGKAEWDTHFPTEWIAEAWRLAPRMLVMPGNWALVHAANALGDYRDTIVLHARNGMTRSRIAFGNWIPVLAVGDWSWEARPNVLPFNVSTVEEIAHPSPKPLSAMLSLMQRYTKPGWRILDPFAGSGTTLKAGRDLGRQSVGIEREAEHCAEIVSRLSQAVLDFGGAA